MLRTTAFVVKFPRNATRSKLSRVCQCNSRTFSSREKPRKGSKDLRKSGTRWISLFRVFASSLLLVVSLPLFPDKSLVRDSRICRYLSFVTQVSGCVARMWNAPKREGADGRTCKNPIVVDGLSIIGQRIYWSSFRRSLCYGLFLLAPFSSLSLSLSLSLFEILIYLYSSRDKKGRKA